VKAWRVGIEEALRIAVKIAEALEAAHEKSIIHRDLKPANVKVTPEGHGEVLDFGSAKASRATRANDDPSQFADAECGSHDCKGVIWHSGIRSPEQRRARVLTGTRHWALAECCMH